jgi:predicted dehydrogenase
MTPRRIGVIGAGQVWRRLYRPAFGLVSALEVAALADPADAEAFASPEAMLDSGEFDGVVVLSPPQLHAEHTGICVARTLKVLVEKPAALSVAELEACVVPDGEGLVRPAFSRRYWGRYRGAGRNGHHWEFRLETNPAEWGATTNDPVERDLLPHVVDLARWLSGEEIAGVQVSARSADRIAGVFELSGGGKFAWQVGHNQGYREELTMDGKPVQGGEGLFARVRRRIRRGPAQDVEGIAEMLGDWALAIDGAAPSRLATFSDARANVATIEQVLNTPLEPNA